MSEEAQGPGARSDAVRARAAMEQMKHVHAVDVAYDMMATLVSFGYQKMGLTEETAELRDLDDARRAIELLRAMLDVAEREFSGIPLGDLRNTLAQMQLSYARAAQTGGGEAAVAPTPEPEAPAPEAAPEPEAAEKPRPAAKSKPSAKKPPAERRPKPKPKPPVAG